MGVKISAMTELPVDDLTTGYFAPLAKEGTEDNFKIDLGELLSALTGGALLAANNLNDLASIPTAIDNLGLTIGTDVQAYNAGLAAISLLSTNTYGLALLTAASGNDIKPTESFIIACSDETTALTAGTAKVTIRLPYAFTVTEVFADLTVAQASGSIFTVDINESGTSILSTKLTINNTETDSNTAATPAVISDPSLARRAQLSVDIDQIGDGTAKGLKVTIVGHRT